MADEKEYKVITIKGVDVAEIEQELERDTTSDATASANVPNCLLYTSPSPRD